MKIKLLNISSIFLLLLLSASAIFGGLLLMTDPGGSSLGLPPDLINEIPFDNYFIPGLVLFVINGLLSFLIAVLTFLKVRNYGWFIIFQGCVLIIWLTVEIIMGVFDPFLHYTCYSIAVLLIIAGAFIIKLKLSD